MAKRKRKKSKVQIAMERSDAIHARWIKVADAEVTKLKETCGYGKPDEDPERRELIDAAEEAFNGQVKVLLSVANFTEIRPHEYIDAVAVGMAAAVARIKSMSQAWEEVFKSGIDDEISEAMEGGE